MIILTDIVGLLGELEPADEKPGTFNGKEIQEAKRRIMEILDRAEKNNQGVAAILAYLDKAIRQNKIPHNLQGILKIPGMTAEGKIGIIKDIKISIDEAEKDRMLLKEMDEASNNISNIKEEDIITASELLNQIFKNGATLSIAKVQVRELLIGKSLPYAHIMWLLGMDKFLPGELEFDAANRHKIVNFIRNAKDIIDELKKPMRNQRSFLS